MSKTVARPPFGSARLNAKQIQPEAKRNGRKFGVTSGLQRTDFMDELLYANYKRQKTDHQLACELAAEFPNSKRFQSIKKYRYYFNRAFPQHGMGIGRPLNGREALPQYGDCVGCAPVGARTPQPKLASHKKAKTAAKRVSAPRRLRAPAKQQYAFADLAAIEGLLREVKWFARRRNHRLRDMKLAKSDGKCEACMRDFSKVLGGMGLRVLVVHHDRKHLSNYRKSGELTKESDLAVICANCHMLLHAAPGRTARVATLRKKLRAN